MVDVEIIREWLAKADEDFEFARINLEEAKPFLAQISFHFQQAAEKYLKSYIIAHELEFLKIHDLPLLLKICISKDSSFEQLRDDCEFLTTFYIDTRYPVHWPTQFSPNETNKAFQATARIRDLIRNKLRSLIV
jgi:HEPN domain-containing protein